MLEVKLEVIIVVILSFIFHTFNIVLYGFIPSLDKLPFELLLFA